MAWKIIRDHDAKNVLERLLIKSDVEPDVTKGEIVKISKPEGEGWQVNFLMVPDLTFNSYSLSQCIGYVHGVEAAVNLYAKETGIKRR